MGIAKINIGNTDYVGAYALATDKFAIIGNSVTESRERLIKEHLNVNSTRISVDGDDLIGLYIAANSNGILLPSIMSDYEISRLRKAFPDLNVNVLDSMLDALRNNVLANDKVAIINPEYTNTELKLIQETLDVEPIKLPIGGFKTVGANNILTNKGIVLNNNTSDEDVDKVKEIVGKVSQSTANLGSLSIGLCAIANSNGLIVGQETTGFELARIAKGLELD